MTETSNEVIDITRGVIDRYSDTVNLHSELVNFVKHSNCWFNLLDTLKLGRVRASEQSEVMK